MAGQTINDRLLAARHSIAGQGLAKSVCKATTEEMIGPKKKHLDYLVQCTNEPNVSIPQLANLLVERSQNANWIVVYKALITVHHMMCYGNERFTQYLASSNSTFQLSNFLDKSGLQGVAGARTGYDMSPFIRRYARYLNEKALSYRTVAFDFCKVKRGKEDGTLRTMNAEKLLKTLPTLQNQLDALLEFDCTANNLTNGVINMCFMLLFRDLIRLFACYNDGVINLLEKYFDMNKKQCREALDLYKKFLIRMDRVAEFLKVAENVGIDKGDIPDLTKAPSSLLDALEQHLAAVEGKKSNTTTPTQTASNQRNVKSAVTALSSTSSAFGTAATNGRLDAAANGIDESLKQQILAEEEAAMNQYKSKVQSPNNSTNPFLSSPSPAVLPAVDLFAPSPAPPPITTHHPHPHSSLPSTMPSDDLLQLNNPFADVFAQPAPAPAQTGNIWMNGNAFGSQQNSLTSMQGIQGMQGVQSVQQVQQVQTVQSSTTSFVSETNFSSVFGNSEPQAAIDSSGSPALSNPFLTDFPSPIPTPDSIPPSTISHDAPSLLLDDPTPEPSTGPAQIIDLFGGEVSDYGEVLPPTPSPMQPIQPIMASVPPEGEVEKAPRKGAPPPRPPPPRQNTQSNLKSNVEPNATVAATTNALDELSQTMMMELGPKPEVVDATVPPLPGGGVTAPTSDMSMTYSGFDGLGGVLQPATSQGGAQNVSNSKQGHQNQSSALLTGDLESSLASLAENLSINRQAAPVKGVQWNSPKNGAKPGSNWTPQPMAATTGAGYRPMGQGMTTLPSQPMFPQMQPMGMRPMATGPGLMTPMSMTSAPPAANQPMAQQQSLLFH